MYCSCIGTDTHTEATCCWYLAEVDECDSRTCNQIIRTHLQNAQCWYCQKGSISGHYHPIQSTQLSELCILLNLSWSSDSTPYQSIMLMIASIKNTTGESSRGLYRNLSKLVNTDVVSWYSKSLSLISAGVHIKLLVNVLCEFRWPQILNNWLANELTPCYTVLLEKLTAPSTSQEIPHL